MQARIFCSCLVLAIAAPLHAQSASRADEGTALAVAAAAQVSPALRPGALDARLLAPGLGDARRTDGARSIPWPEDPGLQAVAAAGIGCVVLGLVFYFTSNSNSRGDNFWWGCLFGGFIGSGAPSGWRLPDDNHPAAPQRAPAN
ncbi:MAG TPA: hypothetical protein VF665_22320 [Longimicrobium sp.]|jgi:hypothetical protein|uniref:hypothetical protein n=1 Tax=Longimicrobium sp. TaxID=2029185 RepID=UPI002ED9E035